MQGNTCSIPCEQGRPCSGARGRDYCPACSITCEGGACTTLPSAPSTSALRYASSGASMEGGGANGPWLWGCSRSNT